MKNLGFLRQINFQFRSVRSHRLTAFIKPPPSPPHSLPPKGKAIRAFTGFMRNMSLKLYLSTRVPLSPKGLTHIKGVEQRIRVGKFSTHPVLLCYVFKVKRIHIIQSSCPPEVLLIESTPPRETECQIRG